MIDLLMEQSMQPDTPLSQVIFGQDYLQLVFQECLFTLYNLSTYTSGDIRISQGKVGFCDALVSLIDQDARVKILPGKLSLHFTKGAVLTITSSDESARGPEAWQFGRFGRPVVVEQNS